MLIKNTIFTLLALTFGLALNNAYATKLSQLEATEFAPGIISTKSYETNTVFNEAGDEVLFSRCRDDFTRCILMSSKLESGNWQPPKVLPFSGDFSDADPVYNKDYSMMYYISKRPISKQSKESKTYNLWRISRQGKKWGEPEYLSMLSSDRHDLYPSMSSDGTLYFLSFRNNLAPLHFVKSTMGEFGAVQTMPAYIYGKNGNIGETEISKDGKRIFFTIRNRDDSEGSGDLYFSRKINGKWSVAETLGKKVNTSAHEFAPVLSPDNKKLYFTRIENGVGNLYGIDLSVLNISL